MRTLAAIALALAIASCGDDPPPGGASSSSSSSGSSGGAVDPPEATGTTPHEICVETINGYRKTKGLPPYARWSDGEACADSEAESDAETNRPHGAFPRCKEMGQNECPGQPGPPEEMIKKCLALMWAQGPGEGHYDMMASTRFKEVSCGFHTTSRGAVWSVQNFR